MSRSLALIFLTALTAVLVAPSAANAATARCRVEKPATASAKVGDEAGKVYISDLAATNLPKHRTLGGSPCATASDLAATWEQPEEGLPTELKVIEVGPERRRGVPFEEWGVHTMRVTPKIDAEPEDEEETLIVTFLYARQRVSLQAHLDWAEGNDSACYPDCHHELPGVPGLP